LFQQNLNGVWLWVYTTHIHICDCHLVRQTRTSSTKLIFVGNVYSCVFTWSQLYCTLSALRVGVSRRFSDNEDSDLNSTSPMENNSILAMGNFSLSGWRKSTFPMSEYFFQHWWWEYSSSKSKYFDGRLKFRWHYLQCRGSDIFKRFGLVWQNFQMIKSSVKLGGLESSH